MMAPRGSAEATKNDPFDSGPAFERGGNGAKRDHRGPLWREAVSAGRDGWIGDRDKAVLRSEVENVPITSGEQPVLAALATAPNRSDSVDHVPGLEAESRRDLGLARLASAKRGASLLQIVARGAMDRTVNAASAKQALIGGVDDGVNVERGDVAFDDLDPAGHARIGRPLHAPIKSAGGSLGCGCR